MVLCPGAPESSTGSGPGFKASQKTGKRLKVSSDRLGEVNIYIYIYYVSGIASSIPARSYTFMEIDREIISTVILLPFAD